MHIEIKENVPVSEITTFQNRGIVPQLIHFSSVQTLIEFIKKRPQYYIIGKGSNTLINPSQKMPPIIQISNQMTPDKVDGNLVRVGAGTSVNKLLSISKKEGLTGLEFCAGVPASIGGMIFMNFGCWGQEISQYIQKVRVINTKGDDIWYDKKDMAFAYRHSSFQESKDIIIEAVLKLRPESKAQISQNIDNAIKRRLSSQPLRQKTFGSTFKNPAQKSAGAIIDELGFRGNKTMNPHAYMSEHHANFMVNTGASEFNDAHELIKEIQRSAKETLGINLELEVQLI